ncbi:MAG: hypothetical protein HGA90_04405, partial [Alphaproteobacteria bacterium]|nr:hypothetical protein [Alphaproteobacteria bacterium]
MAVTTRVSPYWPAATGSEASALAARVKNSETWMETLAPVSVVSAHYVVNESGSEVSQLVREKDRAWQIAASYNCTLNQNFDCGMNGTQMNHMTIGITGAAGFLGANVLRHLADLPGRRHRLVPVASLLHRRMGEQSVDQARRAGVVQHLGQVLAAHQI